MLKKLKKLKNICQIAVCYPFVVVFITVTEYNSYKNLIKHEEIEKERIDFITEDAELGWEDIKLTTNRNDSITSVCDTIG